MGPKDQDERHGRVVTATGMWSLRARHIYIGEFVVFAIPATILLGYFAVLLGKTSGTMFLNSVWSAVSVGGSKNIQAVVFSTMGIGLAVINLSAGWIFYSLSFDYVRGKQAALAQVRRRYWCGLWYAAVPLMLCCYGMYIAFIDETESGRSFLPIVSVSLTILVPVAHLGFAIHVDGISQKS